MPLHDQLVTLLLAGRDAGASAGPRGDTLPRDAERFLEPRGVRVRVRSVS